MINSFLSRFLVFFFFLLSFNICHSQISGPTRVGLNQASSYSVPASIPVIGSYWGWNTDGSIVEPYPHTFNINVVWSELGTHYVRFSYLIDYQNWIIEEFVLEVTVVDTNPINYTLSDENYIHTITPTTATTDVTSLSNDQKQESVTYFDGLGRPKQNIGIRAGGINKDIITHIAYDDFGRQSKEYLPYMIDGNGGMYKTGSETAALTYYDQTKYDVDFPGMTTSDINPYSQKEYDASPLNRVLKQAAPGKDWKLGNGHEIKLEYQTNTNADLVRHFEVSFIGGNRENPYLEDQGVYAPSQLYKTITKDENWVVSSTNPSDYNNHEFKDKLGRVVLKRTFDAGKWHDTYYVYDDYGNLTYVLPPKVFTYHSISQPFLGQSSSQNTQNNNTTFFVSNNGYCQFTLSQTTENSIRLSLFATGFTSGLAHVGLKSGKIGDLFFTPQLPNMTLGNITVRDASGGTVVGGTAYIQNGGLYFSSTGVSIYPTSPYFDCNLTLNLSSLQANYTPQALDRSTLNDLIYQYRYDKLNRLVEKKLPGKEWEYIVYDKLDRPVLTQDANLKATNKWLFTKYDAFSRPVYTGEYVNSVQTTRAGVQALVDASSILFETKQVANVINGTTVYYSNNAFPNAANINLFTINYYDDYSFDLNGGSSVIVNGVTPITNAKGLATGGKIRILGTSNWATNVSYYDSKSRRIYSYSKNDYLATISTVKSQLDFSGKVLETTSTQDKTGQATITIVDKFIYDQSGRLTKQTQTINGASIPEVIVANTYDELGQLTSKKVGGKTINGLQKVNYAYNIRGWLKSINDPNNLNQDNDLFGFELNYNTITNQNKPLYNGNISSASWKTNSLNSVLKQYYYTYDALNRFKTSRYIENNVMNNKFVEYISGYDRNGNIMGLSRSTVHPTVPSWGGIQIDNLIYSYQGNQLMRVDDTSYEGEGFKDGTNTGNDYSYDANGNMTVDKNKGIMGTATPDGITYNHLNLPTKIIFPSGSIDYVYDATGVKQRKIVSTGTTTDYAGGFQYENNLLKFFPQPEGYVDYSSGNFNYIYQYKDHLGNVRLSYADKDNDGVIVGATSTDIFNDGFESSNNWDSLNQIYGTAVTAYDTSRKYSGNVSAKIEKLTAGEQCVHSNTWIAINNTQATEYVFSGWVYSNGPTADIYLFMKTSSETGYYTNVDYTSTVNTNQWVYIEKKVLVPANITKINLRIDNNGGGTVWFDDVSIKTMNTTCEIVEENNYYPFGLKLKDGNNVVTSTNPGQKYKFQGQERQDELGLNWDSFKWRNYDYAIGRFMSIDPLTEKYHTWTPYAFSGNRVVDARELEGLEPLTMRQGIQNLIIVNQGYPNQGPPAGSTQAQNAGITSPALGIDMSGLGKITRLNNKTTQVGVYASSQGDETKNDMISTINSFKKANPNGKVIVVGHSLGADNLVEMANENPNLKIDYMLTIDIADDYDDDNIPSNVKEVVNYFVGNDGLWHSSIGGEEVEIDDPSKTKGTNVKVNSTHTSIDNDYINNFINRLNEYLNRKKDNDESN